MADRLKDDILTKLVDYYESSVEASQEARAQAERDRDYFDHKQLTPDQIAELKKRKQAPSVLNFVQKKVNYLLGAERKNRTDPKAYPRTPIHEDAAHAASDSIRYVCENNNFDVTASKAYENLLIEGLCGSVVEVKSKSLDDYEIRVKRIAWHRIFYDQHSAEEDFNDAQFLGYIEWKDLEEAKRLGQEHGYKGDFSTENDTMGSTYEDRPSFQKWYDGKRRRVKLSYIWFRENGTWMHAIYTKAGMIWGPKPCPYQDEDGTPECNFILQSSMVDRENNRYGYVRSMISPQDSINKRESKMLHLLSQRQTWAKKGAFTDVNKAKAELAKPDGHLEVNEHANIDEHFGVLTTGDMAQGQFLLLQEAKRDLDNVTAQGAVGGGTSQSGRELEIRAQSGSIEITPFTDAHKQWKKRVYRCIWNKVRQFWTAEKWIRVTDDEDNLKWVGLNSPVTAAEQMIQQETGEELTEIKKKYGPQLQAAIQQNPALGQVVETRNAVAELDVDIIIEEGPDTINLQAEQFDTISKVAERRGDVPTSLLIKLSNIRNKKAILDELNGDEQQQAAAAQAQAAAQQLQMADMQADVEEKQARTEKTKQEAIQKMLENAIMQVQPIQPELII